MTTRRNFLRQTALGAAAVAAAPTASIMAATTNRAVDAEKYKSLRLSVLAYSFHGLVNNGMMDMFGFFETCKYRYGLDAADLWVGMFASTDDEYLDKVVSGLEDRQLIVPNIALDAGAHFTHGDEAARKRAEGLQDRYLEIANRLGVGFLRVDAGPNIEMKDEVDGWSEREFDYIVKRYRHMAQYAYDHGFVCGSENHWGPEGYWRHLKRIIDAVDHPGFGICMHFGGWKLEEGINKLLTDSEKLALQMKYEKIAAPYVKHTHIPWDVCESETLAERLSYLRDINYKGYYSVEQHSGQNEYNLVEAQLSKVNAVLTNLNRGGNGELYIKDKKDPNHLRW